MLCAAAVTVIDAAPGQNDLTDMNVVDETGAQAGRYLYRTHENGSGQAAVSATDLQTGEARSCSGAAFGG
jgi:uncharacterized protein